MILAAVAISDAGFARAWQMGIKHTFPGPFGWWFQYFWGITLMLIAMLTWDWFRHKRVMPSVVWGGGGAMGRRGRSNDSQLQSCMEIVDGRFGWLHSLSPASSNGKANPAFFVNIENLRPSFFAWDPATSDFGKYLVAQHADYTNVGKVALFPGAPRWAINGTHSCRGPITVHQQQGNLRESSIDGMGCLIYAVHRNNMLRDCLLRPLLVESTTPGISFSTRETILR